MCWFYGGIYMDVKDDTIISGTDNSEMVKRTAAALARKTAGRDRVIESKKIYNRTKNNKSTEEIIKEE